MTNASSFSGNNFEQAARSLALYPVGAKAAKLSKKILFSVKKLQNDLRKNPAKC
jgi:hypothetical protein